MNDRIVITSCSLDNDKEEIFKMVNKNPKLIEAINKVCLEKIDKGIEIFEQKDNIAITEIGYFLLFLKVI